MMNRSMGAVHSERIKADLTLLAVAIVWGSAFVAQRVAAAHIQVFLFNGFRFLIGALVLLPFARQSGQASRRPMGRTQMLGVGLVGFLLFAAAAFQQLGLRFTTAGNAGFVTGLYVVLIPVILALVWRQWPRPSTWIAALLAITGLFLLSTGGKLSLALGDSLELAGAAVFAFHVIFIGRLVAQIPVVHLAIGQYLVCGLLSLVAGLVVENPASGGLFDAWWAMLYTGVFSIGLGYTFQAVGQKVAPPADAAIILSTEAVFAAIFGWLLLGEVLAAPQLLGCGLMFAGILVAQVPVILKSPL